MGRRKQPVEPGPPSKPLPAEGQGGRKRTPISAFDPAAGADVYEPEKVVGERQKNLGGGNYETQFEVKWKGWDKKHNTYEPLPHLAGWEDMIAEYRERKKQRESELAGCTRGNCRCTSSSSTTPSSLVGAQGGLAVGRGGVTSGHLQQTCYVLVNA